MPVEKVCIQCSKKFYIPPRRSELVKFCSKQCKDASGWVQFNCVKCGKAFSRKKSDNAGSLRKYCSRECGDSDRKGRKLLNTGRASHVTKRCEVCGREFQVIDFRKDKAKFCSNECKISSKAYRLKQHEAQAGEKSWRWTGGKYQLHSGYVRTKRKKLENERVSTEHRDVIFEAMLAQVPDHPFIVEVDGVKKLHTQIEVHHIDRVRNNNKLDNLLAVTKPAHAQIHHRNRKPKPWECWPPDPPRW